MPNRPKASIEEQLNSAQLAINNTLSDKEILESVTMYGYTERKMNEGKSLYESALNAVNEQIAKEGAKNELTARVEKARKNAEDAYQALSKVARAVFIKDSAKLNSLGLKGAMPRTTAGLITKGYTLFDNALNLPEIKAILAEKGYTEEKLKSEREKIAEYDRLNQAQESAKGDAQNAKEKRDIALKAMNDWIAEYKKIAKVALRKDKQLLEKIGIIARTTKTKAQIEAKRKNQNQ